jgi:hypothetical protein
MFTGTNEVLGVVHKTIAKSSLSVVPVPAATAEAMPMLAVSRTVKLATLSRVRRVVNRVANRAVLLLPSKVNKDSRASKVRKVVRLNKVNAATASASVAAAAPWRFSSGRKLINP